MLGEGSDVFPLISAGADLSLPALFRLPRTAGAKRLSPSALKVTPCRSRVRMLKSTNYIKMGRLSGHTEFSPSLIDPKGPGGPPANYQAALKAWLC